MKGATRTVLLLLFLVFLVLPIRGTAFQQFPLLGASVDGIVLKLGTADPLSGVTVELSSDGNPAPGTTSVVETVLTTSDGKFVFSNVPPGNYRLVATKSGSTYHPAQYGQTSPRGRGAVLTLSAGQVLKNVRLEMAPTGSISGRIVDGDGDPVDSASVVAFELGFDQGRQTLNIVQLVYADQHGNFRLFWLPPGRYYIGVRSENADRRLVPPYIAPPGRTGVVKFADSSQFVVHRTGNNGRPVDETYRLVYYGDTTDARKALPANLAPGANLNLGTISVAKGRVETRRIRGRVILNNAVPSALPGNVSVLSRDPGSLITIPSAPLEKDGSFEVSGIVPGAYLVFYNNRQGVTGTAFVDLAGADLENLEINAKPNNDLSGRVFIDGRLPAANDPELARLQFRLVRDRNPLWAVGLPNDSPRAAASPDGTFTFRSVGPGNYRVGTMTGYVKSVRLGAVNTAGDSIFIPADASGELQITLGMDAGRIDGNVVGSQREPVVGAFVVLVPDRPLRARSDLYFFAQTNGAGTFQLQGIPPGSYIAFAWLSPEAAAWIDPDSTGPFESRGVAVRVGPESKQTLSLTALP